MMHAYLLLLILPKISFFFFFNIIIFVGDDCVSIGAGSFNVDIRNITCGPSHGIRYISPASKQGSSVLFCLVSKTFVYLYPLFLCAALEALETIILEPVFQT